jgi:hypothetical protein
MIMAAEIPQPERERNPEATLFNVDAMTDEQITVLRRGLNELSEAISQAENSNERNDEIGVSDNLWERLADEVGGLVERDPERVRGMVQRLALSRYTDDRAFAGHVAPHLLDHDYEFTRDVLVFLANGETMPNDLITSAGSEEYDMDAIQRIAVLMRDRLTPEQSADFNSRITSEGVDGTIRPAAPWET